jgi:hypothetical protein
MLLEHDNYGFSAPVVSRHRVAVLDKGVTGAGPMSEASALGFACEARLAVNPGKLTELVNILLKEH